MRETNFISQNKEKWGEFEKVLAAEKKDPDKLSNLFIQVSDDLSYSRTFYRNRSVRIYLNNLAQQVFTSIYKNKKTRTHKFREFWKDELPQLIWSSRRAFLVSFLVFVLSVVIGVFSSWQDPEFPRVILGDSYVNMTLENIKKHDPMAVYKKMHEVDMFLGIALNNLKVSVLIFLLGLVFSIGSVGFIAYNGIMVGTFQYFFYHQGLFAESALTIWMHGTLEMSAMIIAGAAGITMGNGLVFPNTYTRLQSFMISSRRGLKILLGIAPIVVFAALIESFVTRYTELPAVFKLSVIVFSLLLILAYFVWLPWRKSLYGFAKPVVEAQLRPEGEIRLDVGEIHSNGEIFKNVFGLYRKRFKQFFFCSLILSVLYTISVLVFLPHVRSYDFERHNYFFIAQLFNYSKNQGLAVVNLILLAAFFFIFQYFINREIKPNEPTPFSWNAVLPKLVHAFFLSALINGVILFHNGWSVFLLIIGLPFVFLLNAAFQERLPEEKSSSIGRMFNMAGTNFWKFIGLFYLLAILVILFFLVLDSPIVLLYFEILSWNFQMNLHNFHTFFIAFSSLATILGLGLVFPLVMGGMTLLGYTLREINYATALRKKIASLGAKTNGKK